MSLITWIVPRGNVSSAEKRAISAIAESMLGISRASGANFANSVSRSSGSFFFDSIIREDALDLKSHAKQTSPRLHQPGTSEWTFEQKVVNDAKGVKGTQPRSLSDLPRSGLRTQPRGFNPGDASNQASRPE